MNKELTPLEALNNIKNLFIGSSINPAQQFEIIETALKETEKLRQINCKLLEQKDILREERDKYEEALEIIKEKILDMDYFNVISDRCDLTYQEYELLRKVLKDE